MSDQVSRRAVASGAAWSVPLIAAATAAPAYAVSKCKAPSFPEPTTFYTRGAGSGGGPNGYANNSTRQNSGKYLGTDAVVRYWEWVNGTVNTTNTAANYYTVTRSWSVSIPVAETIRLSGSVMANYGANCTGCSGPAGVMIQTSLDNGTTWTTRATFVSRTGMTALGTASLPINYGGTNTTTSVPSSATLIRWQYSFYDNQVNTSFCNWPGFYDGGAYHTYPQTTSGGKGLLYSTSMPYSFDVTTTGAATLLVRIINFVAPIPTGSCTEPGGSTITYASDDVAMSDPVAVCV